MKGDFGDQGCGVRRRGDAHRRDADLVAVGPPAGREPVRADGGARRHGRAGSVASRGVRAGAARSRHRARSWRRGSGTSRTICATTSTPTTSIADVREALAALRAAGYQVIVAGQPADAGPMTRWSRWTCRSTRCTPPTGWGVAKPAPEFFAKVAAVAGREPGEILYVGDRLDNDVLPASAAGMRTALLRRGPWGYPARGAAEGGAGRRRHRRRPARPAPGAEGHGLSSRTVWRVPLRRPPGPSLRTGRRRAGAAIPSRRRARCGWPAPPTTGRRRPRPSPGRAPGPRSRVPALRPAG